MNQHLHPQHLADVRRAGPGAAGCSECATHHARCGGDGPASFGREDERDRDLVALVRAVQAGRDDAWPPLVARFDRRLRGIARTYRLTPADVDDVIQTTWLRLFASIGRLREPASVPGWLATTTRRECMRVLERRSREQLTDDPTLGDRLDVDGPEQQLLERERRAVLNRALATLPDRHRRLMVLIAADGGRTTSGSGCAWRCRSAASDRSAVAASRAWSRTASCATTADHRPRSRLYLLRRAPALTRSGCARDEP